MNAIISSVIASTVVAAIISSLVSYRLKNLEFRNEYYKIIIQKRLESYAAVERVVLLLQNIIREEGHASYHEIFSSWSLLSEFKDAVKAAKYNGIWIVESTLVIVNEIDLILNKVESDFEEVRQDPVLVGNDYFKEFENLKIKLETACRYDILHLHKIT